MAKVGTPKSIDAETVENTVETALRSAQKPAGLGYLLGRKAPKFAGSGQGRRATRSTKLSLPSRSRKR